MRKRTASLLESIKSGTYIGENVSQKTQEIIKLIHCTEPVSQEIEHRTWEEQLKDYSIMIRKHLEDQGLRMVFTTDFA